MPLWFKVKTTSLSRHSLDTNESQCQRNNLLLVFFLPFVKWLNVVTNRSHAARGTMLPPAHPGAFRSSLPEPPAPTRAHCSLVREALPELHRNDMQRVNTWPTVGPYVKTVWATEGSDWAFFLWSTVHYRLLSMQVLLFLKEELHPHCWINVSMCVHSLTESYTKDGSGYKVQWTWIN